MKKKKLVIIMPESLIRDDLVASSKRTGIFGSVGFEKADAGLDYLIKNRVEVLILDTAIPVPTSWENLGTKSCYQTGIAILNQLKGKSDLPLVIFWGPVSLDQHESIKELKARFRIFSSEEMDPDRFLRQVCKLVNK